MFFSGSENDQSGHAEAGPYWDKAIRKMINHGRAEAGPYWEKAIRLLKFLHA
jgi:hypothetical protein